MEIISGKGLITVMLTGLLWLLFNGTVNAKNQDLMTILKNAGVDLACQKIGIDFENVFEGGIGLNPYKEYTWIVNEHRKVTVIHAIPPEKKQNSLIWEEWYLMKGEEKPHHHILSLWRPKEYTEIYNAPDEPDGIHPKEILGKDWYVVEDKDMKALLLQR